LLPIFLVFAAPITLRGQLLPTSIVPGARVTNWIPGVTVGVPGGIPTNRSHLIDVSRAPYNADRSGATDASTAIQSAISAASAGDVVYLPAGSYQIKKGITITKDNITIRGDGDATVLLCVGSSWPIVAGFQDNWFQVNVTAAARKGDTVIQVADTRDLMANKLVMLMKDDDHSQSVFHVYSPNSRSKRQMTRVTAKTSNSITISPPLYMDLEPTLNPQVSHPYFPQNCLTGVGIENLKLDCSKSTSAYVIWLLNCYGCWIQNVTTYKGYGYQIYLLKSLQCEIRHCYVNDSQRHGPNGSGIKFDTVSNTLVEDNIIYRCYPGIEINWGSCGNVYAYNFVEDTFTDTKLIGYSFDCNHSPHNYLELYEGNIGSKFVNDAYFGSTSDITLFRNWFHGTDPTLTDNAKCVDLCRFSRNFSVVGNVLGRPNYSFVVDSLQEITQYTTRYIYRLGYPNCDNGNYSTTAQPSLGKWYTDWNPTDGATIAGPLITRTSDSAGTIRLQNGRVSSGQLVSIEWSGGTRGSVTIGTVLGSDVSFTSASGTSLPATGTTIRIWPGAGGFQNLDLDVRATTILRGNYNTQDGRIPNSESLDGQLLPASSFRSTKPGWFGQLAWPAFDPANPNMTYDAIPAGYRFVHGTEPPGDNAQTAPTNPKIIFQSH
jgi:hypothetical protein